MEVRRISYFVRIAEDGSLTKAAGVLRIAQPALSRQIRLLEEELGVCLFNRTARGMQLTEEGEYLRAAAAGPLRALELALQNVRSFSARIEGNFAIGMPSSIGDVLARSLALRMDTDYPNIKLRIMEGISGSLIDWLNRGIIDFALTEETPRDDRLTTLELLSERLVLVGSTGTSLDPNRGMTFRKAAELPLILPTHHLGIRGLFNDAVSKLRIGTDIRFEADSCRLIKDLVAGGMGYTILPLTYFRDEYRQGSLRYCPIVTPKLMLTTYLSYRTNHRATVNSVEAKVIDTISRMVSQW
jgi:DNA-binding transcriptional LysR family regulator